MEKLCNKCGLTKTAEKDFYSNKSKKTGFSDWCKECDKARAVISHNKHKDKRNEKSRKYHAAHSEQVKASSRKWKSKNLERCREYNAEYWKTYNKTEKSRKYKRTWAKNKADTDLNFKLIKTCRSRTYKAMKGLRSAASVTNSFGCDNLAAYIRTTYLPGMTDDNYGNKEGQWSVDHIVPISSFDLKDPEQFAKANHHTNLRALWHIDNLIKGAKIGQASG
jgi:hypothetical protein